MGELIRDLRYTVRALFRQRTFSAITIGTIAIAIGANTAIFSVVQSVLLEPLPYEQPEELVVIWANLTARNQPKFPLSPPDLRDLQEGATLFQSLGGIITFRQTLTGGDGPPEVIDLGGVTPNFFDVLGIQPMLGRGFVPSDAAPAAPNADATTAPTTSVVLSHELWQRRYGADEGILGNTIEITGNSAEVVGIMPPRTELHFGQARLSQTVDVWTTPRIDVAAWPARRNVLWLVVGRLNPGVTVAQAQAEMDGFTRRFREGGSEESSLRTTSGWEMDVRGMRDELTEEVRPVLLALFGAVGFVLLIACANVSNLFLVRASGREREFAIRSAMGGSRGQVIKQLLIESGVLAAIGGALGLALAMLGNRFLLGIRPANLPRMEGVGLDPTVLGFTVVASLAAALLFGLAPALKVSNPSLTDALKDRGRSSSLASQRRFRSGIVVTEVALCLVLMIGAGLMLRSFVALQQVDPGFDPEGVLTFDIALPGNRYNAEERQAFFDALDGELAAQQGVTTVSAANSVPLQNRGGSGRYGPLEAANDESLYGQATYRAVRPGYFDVMRTALVEGRPFAPEHFADGTPFVLVDEVLAQKMAPNGSAVGMRMLIRITTLEPVEVEIIGVVRHQRGPSLARDGQETIYITHRYAGGGGGLTYVVRTQADPELLVPHVRRIVNGMDAQLPLSDVRTMQSRASDAMTETRFALVLIGAFGLIALALASIGIYGVLSHIVRQRVGEIGVRMALGAESTVILRLVLGQALTLTGIGIAAGLIASYWTTQAMRGLLIGVPPLDVPTYLLASAAFLAVALLASWGPVRRATRVDPVVALREE